MKNNFIQLPLQPLSSAKNAVFSVVAKAVEKWGTEQHLNLENIQFNVTHSEQATHGDIASNVALVIWGLKKTQNLPISYTSPRQVAEALVHHLNALQSERSNEYPDQIWTKIEVAGPGFINFFLNSTIYTQQLKRYLSESLHYPSLSNGKVIVEFTDPNPFKELHIGHLYSNTVGESIARLLEITGATVKRVCYQGDVGLHVAKSIWGMQELIKQSGNSVEDEIGHLTSLAVKDRVAFVGKAYALGATVYEENAEVADLIKKINFAVFISAQRMLIAQRNWQPQVDYSSLANLDVEFINSVERLYLVGRQWSLAYFNSVYQRVGMQFDDFYFESEVGEYGMKIVKEHLAKGVFEESNGAIIFPGEKYGLHDRVFINSLGLPTYEAKELGLAPTKYRDYPYDFSIIITGNEIDEYFKVLMTALKQVNPELASKTWHMSHGMVRLPEGKMSSRTGKVITAEWLLNEAQSTIVKILDENRQKRTTQETVATTDLESSSDGEFDVQNVSELIGQAAIKYAFLKQTVGGDIAFSFDESLSFSGNSGPYLQYTYARCKSILKKASNQAFSDGLNANNNDVNMIITDYLHSLGNIEAYFDIQKEEKDILVNIDRYFECVANAVVELSPHHLAQHLFELSQSFNIFYDHHVVVDQDWQPLPQSEKGSMTASLTPQTTDFRLMLTAAVANILAQGSKLLGITVLEKM